MGVKGIITKHINMKKIILFIVIVMQFHFVNAKEMEQRDKDIVSSFIDCFKTNNKKKLATFISYPLEREYPIPPIKNEKEFLERYDEIFDNYLINAIKKSDIEKDWSTMGWRGIMFKDGDLYMTEQGLVYSINYMSEFEKKASKLIIEREKSFLHPSVSEFVRPELIMETDNFRIRIDYMENHKFRYSVWPSKKRMSEAPSLIINNGVFERQGTCGNHQYVFINHKYKYTCYISQCNSSLGFLFVDKGDKVVISKPIIDLHN